MIDQKLKYLIKKKRCTLLGVGPMSLNCVDAAIEIANTHEAPIMLIASRRQIDSDGFGGGYVNNWTTEEFANYVIDKDKKGNVLLARDHGGPWQNTKEIDLQLSLRRAMDSAKSSYHSDILAGFQIIHIDPSIDIHGKPDINEILDRLFDLYQYCWTTALQAKKEIIFEVGTEEQSGSTNTQEELDYTLNAILDFCNRNSMPPPTFVVIQCGTRVMEMCNVGSFDSPMRVANEIPAEIQLPKMIEICNQYGVCMKAHNTDYLSDAALEWHPRLGIHAANVAPEFGVAETVALLNILESNGLNGHAERFLRVSYDSNKWVKWMLRESNASDRDRAIIAGHYNFSRPEVTELKLDAGKLLEQKGIHLEEFLKNQVKKSIFRYARSFRLTK